jgi:hypothetical protein
MDILGTFTYSPEEFIENGNIFTIEFGFEQGDTKIVINNHVEKDGEKRTLVIKGAYERSSTAIVPLNHHNNQILEKIDLNHMFEIAKKYMITLTKKFVTEDYPESLKKVAEDRAKNSEKN